MITLRNTLALFAFCIVSAVGLSAQSGVLPDAPVPQQPAGLNLSLPAKAVALPGPNEKPVAKPVEASVCGGSADGLYAPGKNGVPVGQMGVANAYMKNAFSRVLSNWNQRSRHDLSNHVGAARIVRLRFLIFPNGTYSQPQLTGKSGDAHDDERALEAVGDVPSFDVLPEGFDKPLVACMRFGYNMRSDSVYTTEDETWLNKATETVKNSAAALPATEPVASKATAASTVPALSPAPSSKPATSSASEEKEASTCGGSANGVYGPGNHYRLGDGIEDRELLHRIEARFRMYVNPIEQRDVARRLGADGYIRLRFAIRPDGSYFPPEITHSAGAAADDEVLLGAIRRVQSFPQLPADKTLPLMVCLRFHYEPKSRGLTTSRPKPSADQSPAASQTP